MCARFADLPMTMKDRAKLFTLTAAVALLTVFSTNCGGNSSGGNTSPGQSQLSITFTGIGTGTVTSSPAGIHCTSACSAPFNNGTMVTLTATPSPGSIFAGWSGACSGGGACVVTLNSNQSVTAKFTKIVNQQFQLAVTLAGGGSGMVASNPQGISCQPTCTATFAANTMVTLTATPAQGSLFSGWSGACTGTGTCTVDMTQDQSVTATFGVPGLASINHIIFMLQENRSFDHYFGHLNDYRHNNFGLGINDVDGYPFGQPNRFSNPNFDNTGTVQSFHLATQCVENVSPHWDYAHADYNRFHPTAPNAANDGFVFAAGKFSRDSGGPTMGFTDINGLRAVGYYTDADLPYYYYMATQFATSDRWFSPVLSNTEPNRMYLIAATSQGRIGHPGTQLTATTIFQLLDEHNITWKIYVPDPPPGKKLLDVTYLNMFTYSGRPDVQAKIVPIEQYMSDVANGTLPQVAMIEGGYFSNIDEHPDDNPLFPGSGVQKGSKFVSGLINALMYSPSWKDSVFILSQDEFGGFFDHVPPAPATAPDDIPPDVVQGNTCFQLPLTGICGFDFTGFRVPFILISPFTNPHFVSHIPRDHTAILKLIEMRFNLPSLTARDAAQPDMLEFFNFTNPPWATPPPPSQVPAQPDTEVCDDSMLQ